MSKQVIVDWFCDAPNCPNQTTVYDVEEIPEHWIQAVYDKPSYHDCQFCSKDCFHAFEARFNSEGEMIRVSTQGLK